MVSLLWLCAVICGSAINPRVINGTINYDESYTEYVKEIRITDGISTVARLKEYTNLKVIFLPDSISEMPKSKSKLPEDLSQLTIVANKGTYAEEYAKEYGIKFVDAKEYRKNKILNNVDLNSTEPTT